MRIVFLCLFCLLQFFLVYPGVGEPEDGSQFAEDSEISDPLERVNRGVFWFNELVDHVLFERIAEIYHCIAPQFLQTGINNFFYNSAHPAYIVSDLIQFKFDQARIHTLRFLLNSTGGVLGLVDLAGEAGLKLEIEDFGVALAYHGVPAGPYLVLPFLGPSNLRDAVGRGVDGLLDPLGWLGVVDGISWEDSTNISYGLVGTYAVQTRSDLLEAVRAGRESSLDYYYFVQSTYYQYRLNLLWDGNPPGKSLSDDELLLLDDWNDGLNSPE